MAIRVIFTPWRAQLLREIGCGGLAFDRGIGCEDNFVNVARLDAADQVVDPQLLGADAVQGGERSVQDVIGTVEVFGFLDCGDVGGLFDHADEALVAGGT